MRIMEQLRLTALGELLLEPQPDRSPGPGEVVLEVVVAGISGSGVHGYRGVNGRRDLLRALGLPTLPFGAEPRRTPDAVAAWAASGSLDLEPLLGTSSPAVGGTRPLRAVGRRPRSPAPGAAHARLRSGSLTSCARAPR